MCIIRYTCVTVYNGLDKTQVPSMPPSIAPPEWSDDLGGQIVSVLMMSSSRSAPSPPPLHKCMFVIHTASWRRQ